MLNLTPIILLLPLAGGARIVFLESLNTQELLRALRERDITLFCCVPQFFYLIHQRVMDQVNKGGWVAKTVFRTLVGLSFRLRRVGINVGPLLFGRIHKTVGPRMRLFVTGGSKFDPAIGRDFYAFGFTILQAYGLTETASVATAHGGADYFAHPGSVGKAAPTVEIRVVTEDGADAPTGERGEVWIKGPTVMLSGYWRRPDANAQVLSDGWFHTGDIGYLDADGYLYLVDRAKDMIIRGGENVYPREIEEFLYAHPAVADVQVIGVPDQRYGEEIMAWIRLKDGTSASEEDVKAFCRGRIAHYKVPRYVKFVDEFPMTVTGKILEQNMRCFLDGNLGGMVNVVRAAGTARLADVLRHVRGIEHRIEAHGLGLDQRGGGVESCCGGGGCRGGGGRSGGGQRGVVETERRIEVVDLAVADDAARRNCKRGRGQHGRHRECTKPHHHASAKLTMKRAPPPGRSSTHASPP